MSSIYSLEALSNKETNILLSNTFAYSAEPWWCSIERKIDGSHIKVEGRGSDPDSAITAALSKWSDIMRSPRQVFEGALLEAPAAAPTFAEEINDEIPF